MKAKTILLCAAIFLSFNLRASEPGASPTPGQKDSGESVSAGVQTHTPPAKPVGVKPVAPGGTPGESNARLGADQQSSMGLGLQFRFGEGARPTPTASSKDDDDGEGE